MRKESDKYGHMALADWAIENGKDTAWLDMAGRELKRQIHIFENSGESIEARIRDGRIHLQAGFHPNASLRDLAHAYAEAQAVMIALANVIGTERAVREG